MDVNSNLQILRGRLKELQADAILVSMHSAFENTDSELSDINFISGFSGSNGRAIVTGDSAVLSVDGRYTKQAREQTDSSIWEIELYPDVDILAMIKSSMKSGQTLAVGTFSVTYRSYLTIKQMSENLGINLLPLKQHPIVEMKPRTPSTVSLRLIGEGSMGETISDRISRIKSGLDANEAILLADKITIGWAFGIRRTALTADKSVLANCIALIPKSGKPVLFCDLGLKVSSPDFELKNFYEFEGYIRKLEYFKIKLDFQNTPAYFALALENLGFDIQTLKKNINSFESVKNEAEIENQKAGAKLTSLAFIKTLAFAENVDHSSESEIAEFFENEIMKNELAVGLSFNSISAFSKNTSIVHYNSIICGNSEVSGEGLFLFDAGAHFENATTDMTRTIFRGENPPEEFRRIYSTVLKSLIMFSSANFPENSMSSSVDTIARFSIWKAGYDYAFGTGHGVGCFGNVHEPPRISQASTERICKNMILTVEPGIYQEDFGIRIENMLLTNASSANPKFLQFETLTFIPFCRKLIDKTLLDNSEISWLNAYHSKVFELFKDELKDDKITMKWLRENTEEI